MNKHLDVLYVIIILLATVIIWRALWNLLDSYVPNTTKINIMTLIIGAIVIGIVRYLYDLNI